MEPAVHRLISGRTQSDQDGTTQPPRRQGTARQQVIQYKRGFLAGFGSRHPGAESANSKYIKEKFEINLETKLLRYIDQEAELGPAVCPELRQSRW